MLTDGSLGVPEQLLTEVPELDDAMVPSDVALLLERDLLPKYIIERRRLDRIDRWARWEHDLVHRPRQATLEYRQLVELAPTPWLQLVVTNIAQGLFVEGYRRAQDPDDAGAWHYWQANRMDGRQGAIHRAALTYGMAYALVLPGMDPMTHVPTPMIRGISPRRGMAFYHDPVIDEWPEYFLRVDPASQGKWNLALYDSQYIYWATCDTRGGGVKVDSAVSIHGAGICPVVRYNNLLDLEARSEGEVEPLITVAHRINQTVADRLIVQRFAAWVTRTISGMAQPDSATKEDVERAALNLQVAGILIAEDPDAKFGSLPATPLDGFIGAREADIQDLAAVAQIPAFALIAGKMANLSADALAAASAGLSNRITERKYSFGESHEQMLRLAAHVMGDEAGAADVEAQVRWRDMGSKSLAQAADSLGKLAQMLGVPVELLWEQIPGWTQQDVERAKDLVNQQGGMAELEQILRGGFQDAGGSGQTFGGERETGDSGNGSG